MYRSCCDEDFGSLSDEAQVKSHRDMEPSNPVFESTDVRPKGDVLDWKCKNQGEDFGVALLVDE
jgi:hypothetical protein